MFFDSVIFEFKFIDNNDAYYISTNFIAVVFTKISTFKNSKYDCLIEYIYIFKIIKVLRIFITLKNKN